MPVIYYGPNPTTTLVFPSNDDLAHFQAAAFKRFGEGRGFVFTGAAADNSGNESVTSFWMHPTIPLQFSYDVLDEYGEYVASVEIDEAKVDRFLAHMSDPIGVVAGFTAEGPSLPFAPGPKNS